MTAAECYDEWFPSNFLKADDLDDGPMTLTISDIHPEKMQDGNSKPCVFFKEDKRALVLNVTNKNSLIMLSKSKNPADAIGLRVMLVQVEAEYQGKPCKALRIRKPPTLGGAAAADAAAAAETWGRQAGPAARQEDPRRRYGRRHPVHALTHARRHADPPSAACCSREARQAVAAALVEPRRRAGRRGGGDREGAQEQRIRLA